MSNALCYDITGQQGFSSSYLGLTVVNAVERNIVTQHVTEVLEWSSVEAAKLIGPFQIEFGCILICDDDTSSIINEPTKHRKMARFIQGPNKVVNVPINLLLGIFQTNQAHQGTIKNNESGKKKILWYL